MLEDTVLSIVRQSYDALDGGIIWLLTAVRQTWQCLFLCDERSPTLLGGGLEINKCSSFLHV